MTALLRARHAGHINAAMEKLRQAGITGNQMPSSGLGGVPDDFTVKTQASEALTRGLYTSVAAFVLANMPKLDAVNLEEMNATLARATSTMTALLAGIAAISLVVGGVGIMNIMLVAVKERTREIGVRRAVGARKRDVLVQFLVEALTLSTVGGALGIVCGLGACAAMTALLEWPARVSLQAVAVAFGISAVIGIFFGYHPARRAAQLDPIDALRSE
jgi:ABC-type antimicrobial peptide transport system permease subunit